MAATGAAPRSSSEASFLSRLRRLSSAERALLVEAFVILAACSAAIRVLRFTRVGRLASWPLGRERSGSTVDLPARVAWAVRACGRRAPWRAVCFQQGLTAQIMLRRRGVDSTLYFGAALEKTEGLSAHVWVKAGERDVVGCDEALGYAALAAFPATPNEPAPDVAIVGGQGRFDPI
jgi:hypothetical protein